MRSALSSLFLIYQMRPPIYTLLLSPSGCGLSQLAVVVTLCWTIFSGLYR